MKHKRIIRLIYLFTIISFYSCSQKNQQPKIIENDSSIEESNIKDYQATKKEKIGGVPIEKILNSNIEIEANSYDLRSIIKRNFGDKEIEIEVFSNFGVKDGRGDVDSIRFYYLDKIHVFKSLNLEWIYVSSIIDMNVLKDYLISFNDFNFDNHPDLVVYNKNESGVKNMINDIYVYSEQKKEYDLNKLLSTNSNFDINEKDKVISFFHSWGHASKIYTSSESKWKDSELIPVKYINQKYNDSIKKYIKETKILKDTTWSVRIDTLTEEMAIW